MKKAIIARTTTATNVDADPKVRGASAVYTMMREVFVNPGPHPDCQKNWLVHNPMKLHVGHTDIELICCR